MVINSCTLSQWFLLMAAIYTFKEEELRLKDYFSLVREKKANTMISTVKWPLPFILFLPRITNAGSNVLCVLVPVLSFHLVCYVKKRLLLELCFFINCR